MRGTTYHVEIDGTKYRLAETAEGNHYEQRQEPLRPPNAQVVQGDQTKFQLRPDMLVWRLDDWSGGMSQLRFDPQTPNRWFAIIGDVFLKPGELHPPYLLNKVLTNTGTTLTGKHFVWHVDESTCRSYHAVNLTYRLLTLDPSNSAATSAITGLDDATAIAAVAYDGQNTYFTQAGNNTLYRATNAAPQTSVVVETGAILPTGATHIAELGPYVYLVEDANGFLYEAAKSGAGDPVSLVEDLADYTSYDLAVQGGKIYMMAVDVRKTTVWEVVPTSAAGPGFGRELLTIPGVLGTSLWASGGLLYVAASDNAIFYIQVDGSYGTLGTLGRTLLQDALSLGSSGLTARGTGSVAATTHYVAAEYLSEGTGLLSSDDIVNEGAAILEVDSIGGGFAYFAVTKAADNSLFDDQQPLSVNVFPTNRTRQAAVLASDNGDLYYTMYPAFMGNFLVISPWHDFSISEEKVLSMIRLDMEALPHSTSEIHMAVQVDPDGSWTEVAVADDTDSGPTFIISTAAAPIEFNSIRIMVWSDYGTSYGTQTDHAIRSIELYAQVPRKVKVWDLLLDLANSSMAELPKGRQRRAAFVTTAAGSVVSFRDGYESGDLADVAAVDVVVDSFTINLSKAGEGVGAIRLREIG